MFGELMESRAKRQRRAGGATLSIALHLAIIGAVAVETAHGTSVPKPVEKPPTVVFVRHPEPREHVVETRETGTVAPPSIENMVIRTIEAPTMVPVSLPPIDATAGIHADSIVIGGASSTVGGVIGAGHMFDPDASSGGSEWNVTELMMHVLTPAKPRYPESLRSAGIDGRVLVEFMVDTTGRVDMSSVKVLSSTHDSFTNAVREALGNFRFRVAEVGGRRVAARAQMPFEFQISR